MFYVRSAARTLPPQPPSRGFSACAPLVPAAAPRPLAPPPSGPHTSPSITRPAFDSAERGGLQSAAELRHVQRHGRGGLQSAAELRHVQRHGHGLDVPGALRRACSAPLALQSRVVRVRATLAPAAAPRPLAFWPAHLAPHHLPSYRPGSSDPGRQCHPPTSCRSVAHGRAPQPSPLPATTRPGLREAAASEDRPACALRPAESLTLRPKFGAAHGNVVSCI